MIVDLNRENPGELHADVAIIGSGAAGQTVARNLARHGLAVIVLESGGLDFERKSAGLNAGENIGLPYYDLEDSRLRLFGGTTAIWGGRNTELDPIDFERRSWVRGSGWPISYADLKPFYDRAWSVFGVDADQSVPVPDRFADLLGQDLAPKLWRIDRKSERFGIDSNADLVALPNLTVVIHATVSDIGLADDGCSVSELTAQSHTGAIVRVKARHFVVAAGGIENARLLLASNKVHTAGIGNDSDLVGRYFMEHPHARGGWIESVNRRALRAPFRRYRYRHQHVSWAIAGTEEFQRREGALNSAISLALRPSVNGSWSAPQRAYLQAKHRLDPHRRNRAMWHAYKRTKQGFNKATAPLRDLLGRRRSAKKELAIVVRAEQSPNPDSRVMLSEERDWTGMPRVKLDWRIQRQDKATVAALIAALDAQLQANGQGTAKIQNWVADPSSIWESDPLVSAHPLGGYHHMGTTRMSDSPTQGVVDGMGKVHGVENLFVVGSSLFPTAGWANPTLTIIALALRTSDHIAGLCER